MIWARDKVNAGGWGKRTITSSGKKQFVDIIPHSKVIDKNVQHYYGQRLYIFPVLQHFTHMQEFFKELT